MNNANNMTKNNMNNANNMTKNNINNKNNMTKNNINNKNNNNQQTATINKSMVKLVGIFNKFIGLISAIMFKNVENDLSNLYKSYDINPNETLEQQLSKIRTKIELINEALKSKEGKEALVQMKVLVYTITQDVIIPSFKEIAEEIGEITPQIGEHGLDALFALYSSSFLSPILNIPKTFLESLSVFEKSVTLLNNILNIVNQTTNKIQNNTEKINQDVSAITALITKAIDNISNGLEMVENSVENSNYNNNNQYGGTLKNLKHYKHLQKEAKMIGGRIRNSRIEFLSSNINNSHNNSHKVKQNSRKHNRALKRKRTFRKR